MRNKFEEERFSRYDNIGCILQIAGVLIGVLVFTWIFLAKDTFFLALFWGLIFGGLCTLIAIRIANELPGANRPPDYWVDD